MGLRSVVLVDFGMAPCVLRGELNGAPISTFFVSARRSGSAFGAAPLPAYTRTSQTVVQTLQPPPGQTRGRCPLATGPVISKTRAPWAEARARIEAGSKFQLRIAIGPAPC